MTPHIALTLRATADKIERAEVSISIPGIGAVLEEMIVRELVPVIQEHCRKLVAELRSGAAELDRAVASGELGAAG